MQKSLGNRYVIWILATVFFGFQFILRMSVGILRDDIMSRYGIDLLAFGTLAGIYYVGYSIMQIPIGVMLDKFNFKYVGLISLIVTIISTLLFSNSDSWNSVLFARFLAGCGSSGAILFIIKIINTFFDDKKKPIMLSISAMFGLLCAIFGGTPMKALFIKFGYNTTFSLLVFFGCIIAFFILITKVDIDLKSEEESPNIKNIIKLLINPTVLIMGISGGLMVGTLEGFADVWGIALFNQFFGFTEQQSIFLTSLVFLGMAFSGPFVGYISQALNRDNLLIVLIGFMTCILYVVIFVAENPSYEFLCVIVSLLGVTCQYQLILFNIVSRMVPSSYATIAVAVINSMNMAFGSMFHKIITTIVSNFSEVSSVGAKISYKKEAFIYGIGIIPTLCFIGSIGFIYVFRRYKNVSIV